MKKRGGAKTSKVSEAKVKTKANTKPAKAFTKAEKGKSSGSKEKHVDRRETEDDDALGWGDDGSDDGAMLEDDFAHGEGFDDGEEYDEADEQDGEEHEHDEGEDENEDGDEDEGDEDEDEDEGEEEDSDDQDSEEEKQKRKRQRTEKRSLEKKEAEESKKGLLERILSKANSTSLIRNKMKREDAYHQLLREKSKAKKKLREQRKKEREALGDEAPPLPVPKTLDNTREKDETIVDPTDEEVFADEAGDEFKSYFDDKVLPRIMITSSKKGNKISHRFCSMLAKLFPNSRYVVRQHREIKAILNMAKRAKFTDVMVIGEHKKDLYSLMLIHLPHGPTAFFRLTNVMFPSEIEGARRFSRHKPELILNNFNTRLGHTVGRMISALLPQEPTFRGRRVITFHNQRDFIFFRHHIYEFEEGTKAHLRELGPRFTLKLKSLQKGLFNPKDGEYVWKHKPELHTSRRRFFL
eukprot:TRINITY_DN637_c0_g3_i1.p1 TRINITY_DN637_c0_g3~~TRINITY_DN637_c0_g3_i1.p1  ORF type:complete len:466 (+),score=134.96 TRINITY_DN637_c0_g3_i1:68-1465(+)